MPINSTCRVCRSSRLQRFLSLGNTPLANSFLKFEQLSEPEPRFPLEVYLCEDCSLVQLIDVVDPELMFKHYVYFSSTSESFVAHFRSFAEQVFNRFGLGSRSLVVDVGSNDGILLRPFQRLGAQVLGIDPAENVAKQATENGIETWAAFFGTTVAREILEKRGKAKIITAANVFAHVNDLEHFVSAVQLLLEDGGVFIVEAPYLADLLEKNLFDTIYHEHLSYYSVRPLKRLFERLGMEIFDVQQVSSHGGSLRVFVKKTGANHRIEPAIEKLLQREHEMELYSLKTWRKFSEKISQNKVALKALLENLRRENKRIIGYGAPAKGNTLLNYFEISANEVEYIVDDSPAKQGLYTPGTHIPVVSHSRLEEDTPDYVFILAWNFAAQIVNKLSSFRANGGRFIVPVPHPQVI